MDTRSIFPTQDSFHNHSFLSFVNCYENDADISKPVKAFIPCRYPNTFLSTESLTKEITNTEIVDYDNLLKAVDTMNAKEVDKWIKMTKKNIQTPHKLQSLVTLFGCVLIYFVIFGMMNGCLSILKPLLSTIHGDFKADTIVFPYLILSFLLISATNKIFEKLNIDTYLAVLLGSFYYTIGLIVFSLLTYNYYANVIAMVFMGLGASMLLLPTTKTVNTWFDKHISLAQSMLWLGANTGTLIMPYTLKSLIFNFNLKIASNYLVLLCSFLFFIAGFCCVDNFDYLIREKLLKRQSYLNKNKQKNSTSKKVNQISFALMILTTTIIENLNSCFRINIVYLFMSYGINFFSVNDYYASMNCSGIFGALIVGILADIGFEINLLQSIFLLLTGLTTILIWVPGFHGTSLKMKIAVVLQGFLFSGVCTSNSLGINLKIRSNNFNQKFSLLCMIQSLGCLPLFEILQMQSNKSNKYYFICMSALLISTSLLSFTTYALRKIRRKEVKVEQKKFQNIYTL